VDVVLRRTRASDLDRVLALERATENAPYIGQWSLAQHSAALASAEWEHWIIVCDGDEDTPEGFLIAQDLRAVGKGVYIKRIVARAKNRGVGRRALEWFIAHAFQELAAAFVWLAVFVHNERARHVYRTLGFRFRGVPEAEADAWLEVVGNPDRPALLMFLDAGDPAGSPHSHDGRRKS